MASNAVVVGRVTLLFIITIAVAYSATHASEMKVLSGTFLYWIQDLGAWGVAMFFVVYVLATVLMIPTTLLNLGAGYCFGVWIGFPCILAGGVVGASIAFLLGRTLARDCVRANFGTGHIRRVDQVLLQGRGAWKFVFLSRVPPCMPFPIMNYLYGTSGVDFYTYVSASTLGLIPGSFMYVYTGHALRSLNDLLSGDLQALTVYYQMLCLVGVVTTVLVSIKLANDARLVGQPIQQDSGEDSETSAPFVSEWHDEELGLDKECAKPGCDGFVRWLWKFDVGGFASSVLSASQLTQTMPS